MKTASFLVISWACVSAVWAAPPQIYKSVDAEGHVTYSATPPPEGRAAVVEPVVVAPPPSEAQRKQAQERFRRLTSAARQRDRERAARQEEKSTEIAEAERAVSEAQKALEKAKVKKSSDWQTLITGGRVLKQEYFDRVDRAEQRLQEAEEALSILKP